MVFQRTLFRNSYKVLFTSYNISVRNRVGVLETLRLLFGRKIKAPRLLLYEYEWWYISVI